MKARRYAVAGLWVLAVALVAGCVSKEVRDVRSLAINPVDLGRTRDGDFRGEYSYGDFTYVVDVTILDHRIRSIEIVANRDTKHAKLAEGVISSVIEQQRNDVDVVTGATTTSKALLKAIENALVGAL